MPRIKKGKEPKRVRAGKKGYETRLKHERNRDILNAGASFIPGYGAIRNTTEAISKQRKIDSRRKR